MATIDIIILVIVAAGLVHGFMMGAVRQVASIVGIVASFALAVQLMRPVGESVVYSLGWSESIAPITGFALVFIGVLLGFFIVGRMLESLLEALKLSVVNRALGGALGGFKAALLLSVAFLLMAEMELMEPDDQEEAIFYEPVADVLPETWEVVSEQVPELKSLSEEFSDHIAGQVEPEI